MKKLTENFSGNYNIMRVIFSTSDPLKTLQDLKTKVSYKTFVEYLEYLDAKVTMEEEAIRIAKAKAKTRRK